MGYYWDPLVDRWKEIDHDRVLTRGARARLERRGELLEQLLAEIEHDGTGVIGLYAGLLAWELIELDEVLVRGYAKRLKALSSEGVRPT